MTQHTPGAWLIKYYDKEMYVIADELRIAKIPTLHKHGNRQASDLDEENANAHLIAAAPDMLEALGRIAVYLKLHDPDYWDSNTGAEKIRNAIKKARGEK